jgi:hypothetical protein
VGLLQRGRGASGTRVLKNLNPPSTKKSFVYLEKREREREREREG